MISQALHLATKYAYSKTWAIYCILRLFHHHISRRIETNLYYLFCHVCSSLDVHLSALRPSLEWFYISELDEIFFGSIVILAVRLRLRFSSDDIEDDSSSSPHPKALRPAAAAAIFLIFPHELLE